MVPDLVHRLSLDAGPSEWANVCLAVRDLRLRELGFSAIARSDLNIDRSVAALENVYLSALRRTGMLRPQAA